MTALKGINSMKLHRVGVTQKTAWHMPHRIRRGLSDGDHDPFTAAVEADETYVGGHVEGDQDGKGKAVLAGGKERSSRRVRARVLPDTRKRTLREWVHENIGPAAMLYTDELLAYRGVMVRHEAVNHSGAGIRRRHSEHQTGARASGPL